MSIKPGREEVRKSPETVLGIGERFDGGIIRASIPRSLFPTSSLLIDGAR